MNSTIQYYKMLLRVIYDGNPLVPQTCKGLDGQIVTSLTSNYLCLQCSSIVPEEERTKHGNKKSHRFCVSHHAHYHIPFVFTDRFQMLILEVVLCSANSVRISCGTRL